MREKAPAAGLKRLRGSADEKPQYPCDNCKCVRYVPCKCRKGGRRAK